MITLADLNANQKRAVDWNKGPLLVLAGPGSGKTVVLTLRVVRLLEENEDASALALTFTNKAAAEMRDRVDRRLGKHTDRARLCTFHALAIDVLGQHGSHLGIRPDFQPMAQDEDRVAILEEVITDLPDGDAGLPPDRANLLHLIDRLFSESYGGDGPSSSLTTTPPWLPPLFRRYCDALVAANRLDFGSLLHFANAAGHVAEDRFRVREAVVPYAETVRQAVVGNQAEEAQYVGRDIRDRGLTPADCAVLGRTNRLVRLAADVLQLAGHAAFVPQGKGEFDSPVPGVLVEALRQANSRHDRVVLRRMCRQWERLRSVAIEPHAVGAAAALAGGDFLRAWADAGPGEGRTALQQIRTGLVDGLAFPGIVDSFLDDGWRSWGDGGADESSEEEVETWRILHRTSLANMVVG